MNNRLSYERYQRQVILKGFGEASQLKLQQAKVLVIGAGGLGCPVLQYLAGAGVGTIGIVDDDAVSLSNLQRQVLYNMQDIGLSKATVAAQKLGAVNDEINFQVFNERLINKNALSILSAYDIIIDGTDNFSSRYLINDACVLLGKPLVYGAILKFEGQVAVFNVKVNEERTANYRDLFADPPKDDEVLNCAEAGVLGVLPGIIGTMMANETIKLITGLGSTLINTLLTYNALDNSICQFNVFKNSEAQLLIPVNEEAFLKIDYAWLCTSAVNTGFEIDAIQFNNFIDDENTLIIDVREKNELPAVDAFMHQQISLNELLKNMRAINKNNIVLFCQSGKRSLQVAKLLKNALKDKNIYSLKGGIGEWKKVHSILHGRD